MSSLRQLLCAFDRTALDDICWLKNLFIGGPATFRWLIGGLRHFAAASRQLSHRICLAVQHVPVTYGLITASLGGGTLHWRGENIRARFMCVGVYFFLQVQRHVTNVYESAVRRYQLQCLCENTVIQSRINNEQR